MLTDNIIFHQVQLPIIYTFSDLSREKCIKYEKRFGHIKRIRTKGMFTSQKEVDRQKIIYINQHVKIRYLSDMSLCINQ